MLSTAHSGAAHSGTAHSGAAHSGTASSRTAARRSLALLATAALAASLLTPALSASAAGPASVPVQPASDRGLFGSTNPAFDGVPRQGLALIGMYAVGVRPPSAATGWLRDQQCPDGSFAAYRADTSAPCPEPDPATFSGKDTNSTALAAIALSLGGFDAEAQAAAAWLRDQQQPGGGWTWIPGGDVDTASTGWVIAALRAADPRASRAAMKAGLHFLRRSIIGCTAAPADRFGLPGYPALNPLTADVFGSTQGFLGTSARFPVRGTRQQRTAPAVACDRRGIVDSSVNALSRWNIRQIRIGDGTVPDPYSPGQADWNATALATLALVAAGNGRTATRQAVRQLQDNVTAYTDTGADTKAGALGTLLQVAAATRQDATDFGGVDLVGALLDSMQR